MTVFLTTHYIEEAEKIASTVAIIDYGKIVKISSPMQLKKQTKSKSLEEAFLKLTGHKLREEKASSKDHMRQRRRMWGR
jgi:ABC-2 type transport system ATP-binding protein